MIKVLPDQIINCISAGEVIDRPASVVREFIDNSIDAGATEISVYLDEGGHSLIKVSDNGKGMPHNDAVIAFERHATSKIQNINDLDAITSLGFRGEALPSIAAVSKVLLKTKSKDDDVATVVKIEGGKLKDVSNIAGNVGTEIEARHLFYNTPARKKFLRQPKTEEQKVKTLVRKVALTRPDIRFRLFCNDKEVLNLASKASLLERAQEYFKGATISFNADKGDYTIFGLVGHPSIASGDSSELVLIVNGRLVVDKILLKSIRDGFGGTLKDREYPVGVVHLTMPPNLVDVNVHPQKSEVRFHQPGLIFNVVKDVISSAVSEFKAPINYMPMQKESFSNFQPSTKLSIVEAKSFIPNINSQPATPQTLPFALGGGNVAIDNYASIENRPDEVEKNFRFSNLKYIGQLFNCYLLCELDNKFYIVDMHAAHERYNYNLIRNSYREKTVQVQQLLFPLTVQLSEEGVQNCLEHQQIFKNFGFEIEVFGETDLIVRSIPALLKEGSIVALIKETASMELEDIASSRFDEIFDTICARIACHASIRSGKKMSAQEVLALFASLDSTEFSTACPHGRPVITSFTEIQVERWFGRDR